MTPDSAAERDAALVVFGSFAGSASWICFQAWKNELTHHRNVVESAAVRAAGSVDPGCLPRPPLSPQQRAHAVARLQAVELRASPISRITVLRPFADGHVVLYDSDGAKDEAALSDPA